MLNRYILNLLCLTAALMTLLSSLEAQTSTPDTTGMPPDSALIINQDSLKAKLDTLGAAALLDTVIAPSAVIQADPDPIISYNPMDGMVRIAGGEAPRMIRCRMGKNPDNTLKQVCPPFFFDKTEVTNRQFACFLTSSDSNAIHFDSRMNILEVSRGFYRARLGKELEPVAFVDWYGAFAFAKWAGKSLPTEEEWVLAAWGSASLPDTGLIYPWGLVSADSSRANGLQASGFPATCRTGSFPAGAASNGILDQAGNVAEWTTTEQIIPLPDGTTKRFLMVKGGSFLDPPENLTLTARAARDPHERLSSVGFRCLIRDQVKP